MNTINLNNTKNILPKECESIDCITYIKDYEKKCENCKLKNCKVFSYDTQNLYNFITIKHDNNSKVLYAKESQSLSNDKLFSNEFLQKFYNMKV